MTDERFNVERERKPADLRGCLAAAATLWVCAVVALIGFWLLVRLYEVLF